MTDTTDRAELDELTPYLVPNRDPNTWDVTGKLVAHLLIPVPEVDGVRYWPCEWCKGEHPEGVSAVLTAPYAKGAPAVHGRVFEVLTRVVHGPSVPARVRSQQSRREEMAARGESWSPESAAILAQLGDASAR